MLEEHALHVRHSERNFSMSGHGGSVVDIGSKT